MKKIKTRDKLLDAGYEEIYKYGFQGASIDNILHACSVPKGSMYHHFKSKKELALAVIDERLSPKMQSMMLALDGEGNELEKIFNVLDFIGSVPYLLESGCPLSKLIAEMAPLDKDFNDHLSPIHEYIHKALVKAIETGIEKKEIREVTADVLATYIIGSVWGNISLGKGIVTQQSYESAMMHLKQYLLSYKL